MSFAFCDRQTGSRINEEDCGHSMGLAVDPLTSNVLLAEAYRGIFQITLSGGRKQLVSRNDIPSDSRISRRARLFSGVAITGSGDIYWTEASSDFDLHDRLFVILANPSGRLFKYDRATGTSTVLLDGLYYANGVVLGPDEEYLLVSESMSSQVRRYYLKGTKAGQNDIFVDGLPGLLTSLSVDKDGVWIVLTDENQPSWSRLLSRVPLIRKYLAHILASVELPFYVAYQIISNEYSRQMLDYVGRLDMIADDTPVAVVRLNWRGDIVATLRGATGDTSVATIGGDLYLASSKLSYLRRIKNLGRLSRNINLKRHAEPAPIHEKISDDTPRPLEKKLRVILKDGTPGEL